MSKKELKKVAKRVTKEVLSEAPFNCTVAEVSEIREAIAKELKKEFGKEHSYFVTTKIMLSLWALSVKIEETYLSTKRERFCYKYVENYDIIIEDFEEALENIRLLD